MSATERRARFHELHREGTFLMPNPWDVGSARLLESLGFEALATTSAGSRLEHRQGRPGRHAGRARHARAAARRRGRHPARGRQRAAATPTRLAGVAETVHMLADAGAAGCSIEDYDPATGRIDDVGPAAERVAAAVTAARETGMVLTARAENHFYGGTDLDDTIERLLAYRAAGADVLYAPHLRDPAQIRTLIEAVDAPVNVLAHPGRPDRRRARRARRAPHLDRRLPRQRRLRHPADRRPRAARHRHVRLPAGRPQARRPGGVCAPRRRPHHLRRNACPNAGSRSTTTARSRTGSRACARRCSASVSPRSRSTICSSPTTPRS